MVVLVPPADPILARFHELHALKRSALMQRASAAGVCHTKGCVKCVLGCVFLFSCFVHYP